MKKLMIAAAVVCAAVFANAAQVNWTLNNAYMPGDTVNKLGDCLTVLINSSVSQSTVADAIKNGTFKVTDYIGNAKTSSAGAMTTTGSGAWGNYGTGDSVTAYLVLFDAGNVKDAKNFAFTGPQSQSFTADTGTKTLQFGNLKTFTQDKANWQSIPEPTSGLLLLLGVAGLALRRRRA